MRRPTQSVNSFMYVFTCSQSDYGEYGNFQSSVSRLFDDNFTGFAGAEAQYVFSNNKLNEKFVIFVGKLPYGK